MALLLCVSLGLVEFQRWHSTCSMTNLCWVSDINFSDMDSNTRPGACLICQVVFRLFGRSTDTNTFISHNRDTEIYSANYYLFLQLSLTLLMLSRGGL